MATETIVLDAVLASSGLAGASVANLSGQDGSWATASSNNIATSVRASMPTPSGPPNPGAGLQSVSAQTRKNALSGTGTPTATLSVGVGGTKVLTSSSFSITAASGSSQTNSLVFDFAAVGAASNGSDLEVWIDTVQSGGAGSVRASVDIGYLAWTVDYTAGSAPTRKPARHGWAA